MHKVLAGPTPSEVLSSLIISTAAPCPLGTEISKKLRDDVTELMETQHKKALGIARRALGNEHDAQDAVAEAYIRVLTGKSTKRHFLRVVRQRCIDWQRARFSDAALFDRRSDVIFQDVLSHRQSDRDPLELLLAGEELEAARAIASTLREYRWIREKAWGKQLGIAPKTRRRVTEKAG